MTEKKSESSKQPIGNVTQSSSGPNSPNIATFGPNSPVTLNQRLPPWTLGTVQQQTIAAAVRPHIGLWDGQFDVIICISGDPQSTRMAEAFVAAFRAGGWQLPHGGYAQGMFSAAPVGIEVVISGPDRPSAQLERFLRDLSAALHQAGLITGELGVQQDPQFRPVGRFQVRIGRRPD